MLLITEAMRITANSVSRSAESKTSSTFCQLPVYRDISVSQMTGFQTINLRSSNITAMPS